MHPSLAFVRISPVGFGGRQASWQGRPATSRSERRSRSTPGGGIAPKTRAARGSLRRPGSLLPLVVRSIDFDSRFGVFRESPPGPRSDREDTYSIAAPASVHPSTAHRRQRLLQGRTGGGGRARRRRPISPCAKLPSPSTNRYGRAHRHKPGEPEDVSVAHPDAAMSGREEDPAGPFRGSRRTRRRAVGQHLRARAGAKSDGSIYGALEIDQLVPDVELAVLRRPRRLPNADPASAVTNPPVASTAPPRTAERLARECRRVSARSLAGADNPNPIPESVMPQILLRGLLGDASPRARAHCFLFRRDSASGIVATCTRRAPRRAKEAARASTAATYEQAEDSLRSPPEAPVRRPTPPRQVALGARCEARSAAASG